MMIDRVDRYIYAVTHGLSDQSKEEVEQELRGLIEDLLEAKVQGRSAKQEDLDAVLMELGNPRNLAKEYGGKQRYLVGPGLFDAYLKVLKIVGAVMLTLMSVGFIIRIAIEPLAITAQVIEYIISLAEAMFQSFTWVTISFAVLEFSGKRNVEEVFKKDWTPTDLKPIPDRNKQIPLSEPLVGIGLSVLFFSLFILSGFSFFKIAPGASAPTVIPVLNRDMMPHFLPYLLGFFGIGIVREGLKLVRRTRTLPLALASLVCNSIAVVMAYMIFANPAFWNPNFVTQLASTSSNRGVEIIENFWPILTSRFFYIIALAYVIDTVKDFYRVLWV